MAQLRVCGQINWIFFVLSPILWCPWQQCLGIIIMISIKISRFTCEGQVGWYLSAAKAAGYIYGAIRVLLRSRLSTDNNAHNPIILSCKNTGRWKYHSVMGQLDRSRVQSDRREGSKPKNPFPISFINLPFWRKIIFSFLSKFWPHHKWVERIFSNPTLCNDEILLWNTGECLGVASGLTLMYWLKTCEPPREETISASVSSYIASACSSKN